MASVSFTDGDDYESTNTVTLAQDALLTYSGPSGPHAFGPTGTFQFVLNDTGDLADGGTIFTDAGRTVTGGFAPLTSDRYAVFLDLSDNTGPLKLVGGDRGDVLRAGTGDDTLNGGDGNDVLEGGEGDNVIRGGTGIDTVSYEHAQYSIEVYLVDGRAFTAPTGDEDTLSSIANIRGTRFGDLLGGDAGNNVIEGGAGADVIWGNGGTDTVSYAHSDEGVTVRLARGEQDSAGDAAGDTLSGFTNVIGSTHADYLVGDGGDNSLYGNGGGDRLYGNRGDDRLVITESPVDVDGGVGRDVLIVEANANLDRIVLTNSGFSNIEKVVVRNDAYLDMSAVRSGATITSQSTVANHVVITGTSGDDRIVAGDGGDRIDSGLGQNKVFAGDGADTFIFRSDAGRTDIYGFKVGQDHLAVLPLTSDFDAVTITPVHGGTDTLITFSDSVSEHRIVLHDVSASSIGEGSFII